MLPTPETAEVIRHLFAEHPFIVVLATIGFALIVSISCGLIMSTLDKIKKEE